jgi:hypothetical protein
MLKEIILILLILVLLLSLSYVIARSLEKEILGLIKH